eukprot:m.144528 g.144528  ORF g.144528 m.144528 type:complete len:607 (-) comp14102_c0_seq1:7677-9497(-)
MRPIGSARTTSCLVPNSHAVPTNNVWLFYRALHFSFGRCPRVYSTRASPSLARQSQHETCTQVRRFLTGLKEVLASAAAPGSEQQQLSKLQILETGLAVLLQVTAESSGHTQPLEDELANLKAELNTAKIALEELSQSAESSSKGSSKYRTAFQKEAALRAEAEAKAEAQADEVVELRSLQESLERKVKSLKEKHSAEVRQLEDELSEMARKNEENRIRGQSATNEVVEKKVASTIASFNDKMKRAVSNTESLWKAKLKAAQDDGLVLQKRLAKAKLAAESAHESERHAHETHAVEKADLESQRDAVKEELWTAQADITSLRAELETEQRKAKKAKSKAKKTGEAANTEQEKLTAQVEELQEALTKESTDLASTRKTLAATETERNEAQERALKLLAELDATKVALQTTQDELSAMTAGRDSFQQKLEALVETSNSAQSAATATKERLEGDIESLKKFLSDAGKARDDAHDELRRERDMHEVAKKAIADAEAVTSAATEYKAKWDAQAAELVDTRGELKGTQTELADMKVLFEKTQAHAMEANNQLAETQQHVARLQQQLSGVAALKQSLEVAYKDLEACQGKFANALSEYNSSTTATQSLHLFEF